MVVLKFIGWCLKAISKGTTFIIALCLKITGTALLQISDELFKLVRK